MISGHSIISSIFQVKISMLIVIYIPEEKKNNSSQTYRLVFCLTAKNFFNKNNAAQRDCVCACVCMHASIQNAYVVSSRQGREQSVC